MRALCGFLEAVDYDPPEKVNDRLPAVLANLTARALACRDAPDHGIWELRTEPRQQTHTKAMIWVALDNAVRIARNISGVAPERIAEWEKAAEEIRADYLARAWNPGKQAFVGAYETDDLDAAVMRVALFGAIDPRDPRMLSTVRAIERELGKGDLIYRYRMPGRPRGPGGHLHGLRLLAGRLPRARR